MRIFYLWRLPAQSGDGPRNAYLFVFGDGQRNLATAAQRVSFIFDDSQRNLATACATRIFYL